MKQLYCDGRPADADDLAAALVNFGHFTSMQVRDGAVQGLDLHLQRLRQATGELFGTEIGPARLLAAMRDALQQAAVRDASLRVSVFSPAFDFRAPRACVPVQVLVGVGAPVTLHAPASVRTVGYQRDLPALKHVGTFGLFQQRREAMTAGYDDALFMDPAQWLSEGTTWNLALHDGERLLWPQAPALRGTAEALLQAAWPGEQVRRPVSRDELAQMHGAFACNASGLWALSAIDGVPLPASGDLAAQGRAVLDQVPWQPLLAG